MKKQENRSNIFFDKISIIDNIGRCTMTKTNLSSYLYEIKNVSVTRTIAFLFEKSQ